MKTKNIWKRIASLAMALVMVLGMLPTFPLTARAADADYVVTEPVLHTTEVYFTGENERLSVTPGEAASGYDMLYSVDQGFAVTADNPLYVSIPGTYTVKYWINDTDLESGKLYNFVYGPVVFGTVTMHKAKPEYATTPVANHTTNDVPWDKAHTLLSQEAVPALPGYFAVQYNIRYYSSTTDTWVDLPNSGWTTKAPTTGVSGNGKYEVQYKLVRNLDQTWIGKVQYDWDELLDEEAINNQQIGTIIVNVGPDASVTADPVEKSSITYNGSKQELLSSLGTAENGTLWYAVTPASATSAPTSGWSTEMPTATDAGSYKVWYQVKASYQDDIDPQYVEATISSATNAWTTAPSIIAGYYGQTPSVTMGTAKYGGTAAVRYTGTGGTSYDSEEPPTEAGSYKATFTVAGTNNYNGLSKEVYFKILRKIITGDMIQLDESSKPYTGSEIEKPSVTVKDGDKTLTENIDYTLAWNTDAQWVTPGTNTVTITGMGNYQSSGFKAFTITAGTMTGISADNVTATYDGQGHSITVTGIPEGAAVTYSTDGTTYSDENPVLVDVQDSGTVYYKVSKEHYADYEGSATVTIQPKPVTVSGITAKDKTYDGTANATLGYESVIFDGKLESDTLSVTATGTFEDKNAGEGKNVTISGLTLGGASAGNYKLADEGQQTTATASIKPKSVPAVVTAENKNYDGDTIASVSAIVETGINGETITITNLTGTFADANVGTDITVTVDSASKVVSYSENTQEGNYTLSIPTTTTANITAAPMTVTAEGYDGTYDGEAHGIFVNAPDGAVIKYGTSEDSCTEESLTYKNAGEYTVYYQVTKPNYETVTGSKTVTINKKAITEADVTLNGSLTYNGSEQTQEVTVTEGITYEVTGNKATNVRTYELTVTGTGNYTGEVKLSWSIEAAVAVVGTVPTAKDLTYTGKDQALVNDGVTDDGTMVYSLTEDGEYTESIPNGNAAGSYTVWYKVIGDDNHYDSEPASVSVTIKKAAAAYNAPSANTLTYDGSAQALATEGTTADGTMMYKLGEDGTYSAVVPTAEDAGTYTVYYYVKGDSNHEDSAEQKIDVTIGQLDITGKTVDITLADTLTYNGAEQTMGVSSVKLDDLPVTYTVSGNKGTNADSYVLTVTGTGNFKGTATKEWSIAQKSVTVTAKDQTITYGETISGTEITAAGLVDGHSVTATLTPSTANVTVSGTITADAAVITADGTDVTANYNISYASGKLVIEPDTSKIDALTTDNVTSANEKDIKAVQAMMASAETDGADEATAEQWAAITAKCEALIEKIEAVKTENARIADAAADYDLNTVKSSDEEVITKLISDIEAQLATNNLTDAERSELEGLKTKCNNLIAKIDGTETLIEQLEKEVADLDAETVKSTDKAALEQVIADTQTLIDSGNVTEAEKEALKRTQEDAKALIKVIDDTAAENKALTDQAATFDEDAVKSTDKTELEQLAKDIEALLDTENLTEDERTALEEVLEQVEGMIDTINEIAEDSKAATDAIDALDPATVTSDDKDELEQAIKTIDELLKDDHLTDEERSALEDAKADAEALIDVIEAAQDATNTENTAKVEDVTSENVKMEDKTALEKAKADLEKALADNSSNMTKEEKAAIQTEIDRIAGAVQSIEKVENVTETIEKIPETVTPGKTSDEETVKTAQKAYEKLTDHEKTLIPNEVKVNLEQAVAALALCDGKNDCPSKAFADLDTTAWYHTAVDYVLRNGIMQGDGTTKFQPNGELTRGMIVRVLYNMEGKPAVTGKDSFTDTEDGAWYAAAVLWASRNGIVEGYGNDQFGPNDTLTREQMTTILYRYAAYKGMNTGARATLKDFTDAGETSPWAKDAVQWAVANGIINGYGDGTLRPTAAATRAQVAQIILNFFQK